MHAKLSIFLRFSGVLSILSFCVFTSASIHRNSWFRFSRNAFSDLGCPRAYDPWIYNYGLVVTAILLGFFSVYLVYYSKSRLEIVGSSYISVSSIFLALIGVFHCGTKPHGFVSTYFFVQIFLGILIFGIGLFRRNKTLSLSFIVIFLSSIFGLFIKWSSAAEIEAYEIFLLGIFGLLAGLIVKTK